MKKRRRTEPLPAIEHSRDGSTGSAIMAHFLAAADKGLRRNAMIGLVPEERTLRARVDAIKKKADSGQVRKSRVEVSA